MKLNLCHGRAIGSDGNIIGCRIVVIDIISIDWLGGDCSGSCRAGLCKAVYNVSNFIEACYVDIHRIDLTIIVKLMMENMVVEKDTLMEADIGKAKMEAVEKEIRMEVDIGKVPMA